MFRLKTIGIFAANILLLAASAVCHFLPRGDEYLFLFVVPLVFSISPFALTVRQIAVLLAMNLAFFIVYTFTGVLNTVDTAFYTAVLAISGSFGYAVMSLGKEFQKYNRAKVAAEEKKYYQIVKELETVERKGRIVEREQATVSRLYEITKQLGPVLKFDDLLDEMFDFLEKNFKFDTLHLLVFEKGEFAEGVSKSVAESRTGRMSISIDYNYLVEHLRKNGMSHFYAERFDEKTLFDSAGIKADTIVVYPLSVEGELSSILAIEGVNKLSYDRLSIVVPQIALEMRKVRLYEQVEKLSIIDGLTGVYLRRHLMERLDEEVDRAKRLKLSFSVAMVDIDHFKNCNDNYGHLAGDAVLKEIAERLKASVREVDMTARYGGEEFCILLPETTKELAMTVAERLRKTVEAKKVRAFDAELKVTVSVGVATFPSDASEVGKVIEMADNALYKAKRKGRNQVCSA